LLLAKAAYVLVVPLVLLTLFVEADVIFVSAVVELIAYVVVELIACVEM